MPTCRGISIELHSQFDLETLPEYYPRLQSYYNERNIPHRVPLFFDDANSTCSVYVPVFPGSQFWLSYSIIPSFQQCHQIQASNFNQACPPAQQAPAARTAPPVPPPPPAPSTSEEYMYLFKLYINGAHITSWSCGKAEDFRGKTIFGLFESAHQTVEKRALCFTPVNKKTGSWDDVPSVWDLGAAIEIRVHRAHARKRIEREFEDLQDLEKRMRGESERKGMGGTGVRLVNTGRAGGEHPKRYYRFALVDPVDRPWCVVRYLYRTWAQLEELGLFEDEGEDRGGLDEEESSKRCGGEMQKEEENANDEGAANGFDGLEDAFETTSLGDAQRTMNKTERKSFRRRMRSFSGSSDSNGGPTKPYRLSVPPSIKLVPAESSSRPLPAIPQKRDSRSTSLEYRPHPVYPVEKWHARTPIPIKSIRDGISTPPMGKRRGLTASKLIDVVASAWKRTGRATPTEETMRGIAGGAEGRARSIS